MMKIIPEHAVVQWIQAHLKSTVIATVASIASIYKIVTSYFDHRDDVAIMRHLRLYGVMSERELQGRTGIKPSRLLARLEVLAGQGIVANQNKARDGELRVIWRLTAGRRKTDRVTRFHP
jgi:DNA-binding HxlR family transcriptional regulator